ncbi:MAG: hypothetical protein IKU19_00150, partial [Clostridia bacterium]|nr:hypothetical protein [Clostridia bacterium]
CGKDVEVGMIASPGVTYEWHLTQYTDLRFALVQGGYDYIIIQQAAHEPCPSKEETIRDAGKIIEMARAQSVKVVQTLPWARIDIPEEFEKMKDIYYTLCKKYDVKMNPVGHVFEEIVKNHPDIRLHWFDGAHAGPYGSYANAITTYKTVFETDPVGVSDESFDMYPVDGDTAVCDKDKLLVKLDPEKAEIIRKTVATL